ncbi:MAG: MATE family efflux transporter, partial [Natronospirillum sp.]
QVVNILFSVLLVFGLKWRIAGVAWGSVAGDLCAFLIYSLIAVRLLRSNLYTVNHRLIPSLWHYVQLALPLVIRTFTLLFAFNYFARLGLSLGADTVAANAVLLTFLLLISSGLDGFANAAETLVGTASGQEDSAAIKQGIVATGVWSMVMALMLTLVFALFHVPLIHLLTDLPPVRQLAERYAMWMILMPLYTWWAYWLDGVFIGLQWVRAMRNVLLISVFGVYWPLSLLLPITNNHAIWGLFAAMMALRSGLMLGLLGRRWHRLV